MQTVGEGKVDLPNEKEQCADCKAVKHELDTIVNLSGDGSGHWKGSYRLVPRTAKEQLYSEEAVYDDRDYIAACISTTARASANVATYQVESRFLQA